MYTIFAKRVYNEAYQTDPFPNMSSLLDKYKSYYEGSDENKKIPEFDETTLYNRKKKNIQIIIYPIQLMMLKINFNERLMIIQKLIKK